MGNIIPLCCHGYPLQLIDITLTSTWNDDVKVLLCGFQVENAYGISGENIRDFMSETVILTGLESNLRVYFFTIIKKCHTGNCRMLQTVGRYNIENLKDHLKFCFYINFLVASQKGLNRDDCCYFTQL